MLGGLKKGLAAVGDTTAFEDAFGGAEGPGAAGGGKKTKHVTSFVIANPSEGQSKISQGVANWAGHAAHMAGESALAAGYVAKQAKEASLSANNAVAQLERLIKKDNSKSLSDLPEEEEEVGDDDGKGEEKFDDGTTEEELKEQQEAEAAGG